MKPIKAETMQALATKLFTQEDCPVFYGSANPNIGCQGAKFLELTSVGGSFDQFDDGRTL